MRRQALAALTALALSACSADPAPDAGAASMDGPVRPTKLGLCVACHGETGLSRIPGTPHIAGQDEIYLRKALTEYRDGRRPGGGAMNAAAGGLSAADIDALAAWYAAQPWPGAAEGAP
ncbi:c-type cytochrome [Rehaibacterium terrae]|uniref:c-type cytochrome n=3 Tax=Rehaibacterium terrae TaxID=1341696 RepID=UPI00391B97ED